MAEVLTALLMFVLTPVVYLFWRSVRERRGWRINALIMSVATLVTLLLLTGLSYQSYWSGARFIDAFLEPAVVSLGFPLYKQLKLLTRHWRTLLLSTACSVSISLTAVTFIALSLGIEPELIRSLAVLNVTTPIAMETSALMGGDPPLAALCVMIAGFSGSTIGLYGLKRIGTFDDRALGFAIGAESHALGAATLSSQSLQATAWASTSLILAALLTAILAPHYVPFLLSL